MKRHTFIPILASVLLAASACGLGAAGFLHTQGQDIVDADGNKIMLRGVGLGNWLLPEGYMWKFNDQADRPRKIEKLVSDLAGTDYAEHFWPAYRQNYITEKDVQRIAQLGYNSVRPALNSRLFLTEGDNPVYVDEGFQILDNLVKWSKANGVYVIIDMHAAPGGQTGQNIDDSADDQPELFMDKKYQDRLQDLWVKIATRYKDEPTVAGYDILNEPLPERTGAADKYKRLLEPLYQRITQAIRAVDSNHMIIVEGADWANDWSAFTGPFDHNMVYQFHYYCWDQPSELKSIKRYLDYQKRFKAPIWVGETGEADDAIYWATTQYFEARNIGWSFWPWKKMDAGNAPYSYSRPGNWRAIRDFLDGGPKPSQAVARKAFDELLNNVRLENCTFHPDVVNAMFRRVPGLVEGKNYGEDGPNKSYFVKDSAHAASLYRKSEPVPITSDRPDNSPQVVTLNPGEWTAYTIHCDDKTQAYDVISRVKTATAPAQAQLWIDDEPCDLTISQDGWSEIDLGQHSLTPGEHRLKWVVKDGTVSLDWFQIKAAKGNQLSAHRDTSGAE